MLGFIILLMLPATGTLVPLYVMFSSVQVNSGLAAAIPAVFLGILVALVIWVIYRSVRALTRIKRLPTTAVVVVELVATLAVAWITLAVIFQHSPVYVPAIEAPLIAAQDPLAAAQTDYTRRVDSVQRRVRTADAAEAKAAQTAQAATDMTALSSQASASGADVAALLTAEINKRQGEDNAADDVLLQSALAAQTALQSGDQAGALAALTQGVTTAQADAADAQQKAATARQNATDGQASLTQAQQTLADAQAAFDTTSDEIITLRNNVLLAVFPYALIATIGAALGAAVLMGAVVLVYQKIEAKTFINILALAVVLAIGLGFALLQIDQRLGEADAAASQPLRSTLLGLAIAFASGGLPFAIWNLKGYFDTIPKELEEAALIDGAGLIGTFFRIMVPLALPAFAITILFSFMQGWTEFILSWLFLTGKTESYTLAMALATLTNGGNQAPPDMQKFAALAILVSIPILVLFFAFQRWIVSGLSIGGVKG
jgi:ABC-type maltose transport system permease subunit